MKIKRIINLNEEMQMMAKMNPEFVINYYEAKIAKIRKGYRKSLTAAQERKEEHRGETLFSRRTES